MKIIKNKKLMALVGMAMVLVILIFSRTSKKNQKIETGKVTRKDLVQTISASGTVESEEKVDLKFQTSGLLTWVGVKEGDYVQKWQAIAQLDKRELQKTLDKYLRDYSNQRNDFEEMYRVTYKETKPEAALTDTVRRILEKNQWDLEKAVLDVELKDIALKFATLVTPIEGIITHVDSPVAGVNITPATAVFTVAKPEPMLFKAEVDEVDISKVKTGQEVIITLDAYPEEKFGGEVGKVFFESVSTKGGGTAFVVEVKLPENKNQRFKNGMNGDMEIIMDKKENVLTVPNGAIHYKNGNPFVKIMEKNKIKEVSIKIGLETDKDTEIIDGLTEGQKIIIGK